MELMLLAKHALSTSPTAQNAMSLTMFACCALMDFISMAKVAVLAMALFLTVWPAQVLLEMWHAQTAFLDITLVH